MKDRKMENTEQTFSSGYLFESLEEKLHKNDLLQEEQENINETQLKQHIVLLYKTGKSKIYTVDNIQNRQDCYDDLIRILTNTKNDATIKKITIEINN
jgi:hypothetical protein